MVTVLEIGDVLLHHFSSTKEAKETTEKGRGSVRNQSGGASKDVSGQTRAVLFLLYNLRRKFGEGRLTVKIRLMHMFM